MYKIIRKKQLALVTISLLFLIVIFSNVEANVVDLEHNDFLSSNDCNYYWGNTELKLTDGTGFFDVIKKDGTWWFVTPDGYAFYSTGLNVVSHDKKYIYNISIIEKYGNHFNWAQAIRNRFKEWGFNTLGAWCSYELFDNIPYTHTFIFRHEGTTEWRRFVLNHPDVFDPSWQELVRGEITQVATQLKDDPYLLGYWLDNEIHWGPDEDDSKTLLENYVAARHDSPGKQKVVSFLREKYNEDVEKFNNVWNMNLENFDELYDARKLGREGWRIKSKLLLAKTPLFKEETSLLFNREILVKAESDIDGFSRLVAGTYFNFITSTIRDQDPNHLILGVRFHCAEGAPKEVIEECAEYCDVISINYYVDRKIVYNPNTFFKSLYRGLVPLDQWMKRYYKIAGKPILVGEFNTLTKDFKDIDLERAKHFEWFAKKCLDEPYIVGYHWFSFYGTVNKYDQPNSTIVDCMTHVNDQVYDLHK